MKRMFRVVCAHPTYIVALLLVAAPASRAAVFERDWKTAGDGLLTYDDVNQREWLDIPESLLSQFPGTTLEIKYQAVVAELLPSGMFEGFTPADANDVVALAQSAGIDTGTTDFAANHASAQRLIELLGPTDVFPPSGLALTRGLLDELDPDCNCRLIANIAVGPSGAGLNFFSVAEYGDDRPAEITGVFLYRASIPEPSTIFLATCSLLGVLAARILHRTTLD